MSWRGGDIATSDDGGGPWDSRRERWSPRPWCTSSCPPRSDAPAGLGLIAGLGPLLMGAAVAIEALALAAYAQLSRSLLDRSKRPSLRAAMRVVVSSLAVDHLVPGGSAAGGVVQYRLLVGRGVAPADASFVMAEPSLGSALVLDALLWTALVVSIPATGFQPVYAAAAGTAAVLIVVVGAGAPGQGPGRPSGCSPAPPSGRPLAACSVGRWQRRGRRRRRREPGRWRRRWPCRDRFLRSLVSGVVGATEPLERRRTEGLGKARLEDVDGDLGGDATGTVTAHPVGDGRKPVGRDVPILVLGASPADRRGRADVDAEQLVRAISWWVRGARPRPFVRAGMLKVS